MISILMPIYNGVEYFRESLASVVLQTFDRWELLVGINGYSANSEVFNRISQYNSTKIRVFDLPNVRGKAQALNVLLPHAHHDLICLLDVDDIWMDLKLEVQLGYINKYDVVGTYARYFGDRSDAPAIPFYEVDKSAFKRLNPIINTSAMFHRKDAFWNDIKGVEDYEMWCRLASQGKTFYNVPDALVRHRIHGDSAYNTSTYDSEIKKFLVKYGFLSGR